MAIEYPVDYDNTRWATYQVSTGEIISRNKQWPGGSEGLPLVGDDGTHIMLLHVNDAIPSYDSRMYTLDSTEGIDTDANVIHKTHEAIARSIEERTIAAENEESNQLGSHVSLVREAIHTRLMVGALLAYVADAQAFPPKVDAMATNYKNLAVKLWHNRDQLIDALEAINRGEDVDLDTIWSAPDVP